jgi:hypothetical protein
MAAGIIMASDGLSGSMLFTAGHGHQASDGLMMPCDRMAYARSFASSCERSHRRFSGCTTATTTAPMPASTSPPQRLG